MDLVVTGDSPVAVPVGTTLATKDRSTGHAGPPPPAVEEGPPAFAPVDGSAIGELPQATYQENSSKYYPRDALRMGIEGHVTLRVEIDRHGNIHGVRVIKKAGYGFDEAAVRAMLKFKFRPARTRDGQPVDFLFTWAITFRPSDW
jgi:protein TonB